MLQATLFQAIMMFRSVCCILFFLHTLATAGYSAQAKSGPGPGPEYSPEDALLTIRTHSGQSVFHIGEMIELDLAFTSSAPQKYSVDASVFERPFTPDNIAVTPRAGWEDPIGAFYKLCPVLYEGGLQNDLTLSPQPTIVSIELNKWFRFERPGEFEIKVDSGRVSSPNGRSGRIVLSSNRLPIRIIPATAQWQDETLRNALEVLDQTGTDTFWQRMARYRAARTLRYLGTPAAVREMGKRIKGHEAASFEFILGLASSPAREDALEALKALLVDPNYPVFPLDLCAIAFVALPQDATSSKDALEASESRFRDALRSALANKQGHALEQSTITVNQ
jgi:hypothetical protein